MPNQRSNIQNYDQNIQMQQNIANSKIIHEFQKAKDKGVPEENPHLPKEIVVKNVRIIKPGQYPLCIYSPISNKEENLVVNMNLPCKISSPKRSYNDSILAIKTQMV